MSPLRSAFLIVIAALILFGLSELTTAFQEEQTSNTVLIEFPLGDIDISHVESSRGMILNVRSKAISVAARRLYFGDGKHAVKYEGSESGMKTPAGLVNAATIRITNGETIKTTEGTLEKWGRRAGEVYILVPNLKFQSK